VLAAYFPGQIRVRKLHSIIAARTSSRSLDFTVHCLENPRRSNCFFFVFSSSNGLNDLNGAVERLEPAAVSSEAERLNGWNVWNDWN